MKKRRFTFLISSLFPFLFFYLFLSSSLQADHNHLGEFPETDLDLYIEKSLPVTTLRFLRSHWAIEQTEKIYQGGVLLIEHDDERLPDCRGTYNSAPAWSINAFIRFYPGNEIQDQDVSGNKVARFDVPQDAEEAEIWFQNSGRCAHTTYDSNYGQNFKFVIYPTYERLRHKVFPTLAR